MSKTAQILCYEMGSRCTCMHLHHISEKPIHSCNIINTIAFTSTNGVGVKYSDIFTKLLVSKQLTQKEWMLNWKWENHENNLEMNWWSTIMTNNNVWLMMWWNCHLIIVYITHWKLMIKSITKFNLWQS